MTNNDLLERVRKLLAKAENEGCTPKEAEALTAKAAELMAKHGIDRALLAATKPETDRRTNKKVDIPNPWARVHAALILGLAKPLRCDGLRFTGVRGGERVHLFGFESDLERLDVLYTSLLLQMANGLRQVQVPSWYDKGMVRAERRSWLLGFIGAVIERVKEAERKVQEEETTTSTSTALVLADRAQLVEHDFRQAYPKIRNTRLSYSGNSYGAGRAAGQRANIGGTGLGNRTRGALGG